MGLALEDAVEVIGKIEEVEEEKYGETGLVYVQTSPCTFNIMLRDTVLFEEDDWPEGIDTKTKLLDVVAEQMRLHAEKVLEVVNALELEAVWPKENVTTCPGCGYVYTLVAGPATKCPNCKGRRACIQEGG